jgi:predicted TIM-barrel fold metal-dependent hydrolase
MPTLELEKYKVIDVDTHVSEPEDVWTSRVSVKKWGDKVPHVVPYEELAKYNTSAPPAMGAPRSTYKPGERVWIFGGEPAWGVAMVAMTGWTEAFPSHPLNLEDAHAGAHLTGPRLKYMDEQGIYAQVVFPNVGGFGSGRFVQLREPELMYDCVKAYNDFLVEWCSADKNRLIPLAAMPFWDVDLCVQEIHRVAKAGHRGIVWGGHTESYGLPRCPDLHWEPVWHAAEDLGMSINFHIDGSSARFEFWPGYEGRPGTRLTRHIPTSMLDNMGHITDMILGGVTHRHPNLQIIAVESGVGWIPFVLEMLDWMWHEQRSFLENPDWELTPSEYFKRQCYGCFWAEAYSASAAITAYPDNCLFETDFPHPVSLTPSGVPGFGATAREHVAKNFSHLPEDVLRKVLHGNAARIYHLD